MDPKEKLTNERLGGKFANQFDLVNYAIRLAENMVRSGRSPRIKCEIQNPAVIVLEEITVGKDHFETIGQEEVLSEDMAQMAINMKDFEKRKPFKDMEKKKGKRKEEQEDTD